MSALLVDMVFVVEMLIFKDLLKGWCWDVCFLSGYSDRVVSVGWLAGWLAPERDIELRDCWWWVGPSKAKLGCHRS